MTRFETERLVIEIKTMSPAETWMDLQRGLCGIVRNVREDTIMNDSFYAVIDFLEELLPDWKDVCKMQK
jgi:hypothetical protein